MCALWLQENKQMHGYIERSAAAVQTKPIHINKSPQPNMPLEHKQYQPITTTTENIITAIVSLLKGL